MIKLHEVKNSRYSTEMRVLKVHVAKQVIMKRRFQCLQLYQIVNYNEAFHDQWYRREIGSESCGHFNLVKNIHPNDSCTKCFEKELVEAGGNVNVTLSGTTNSVFITEFDSFFFGLSFYVGWTSLFSRLRNFQLYLRIDDCTLTF